MNEHTRHRSATFGVLLAVVFTAGAAVSAAGAAESTGSERFDGGLIASNASGGRTVAGSAIAMSGVFDGIGRIVERPNRSGDSAKVSRDDLVFAAGTLHIVNTDSGPPSLAVNRKTCTATFKVPKTTRIAGGTGRFAGATGTFVGSVSGSGVARRNADGSCDQQHAALIEIDTVTATGTMTF
jgi:hypothetical protein